MRAPRWPLALLLLALPAAAAPKKPTATAAPAPPPAPLGHVALSRVDVTLRADSALVTAELTFTRGAYREGDVEVFYAYGSPGLPRAFEARLLPVAPGFLAPAPDAPGQPATATHALGASPGATLVVGPRAAAGQRVQLTSTALAEALAPSGLAALRLRWVQPLAAAGDERSVLVRATSSGTSLPIGALSLQAAAGRLTAAGASLCGAAAVPLALVGQPARPPLLAPPRLPAGASGDLCFSARP